VIGVWELMFLARTLGQKTFQHMEMLITAAVLYWILSIILELIQARIERHYARSKKR
jgi:polar amino acid transport system permease protein